MGLRLERKGILVASAELLLQFSTSKTVKVSCGSSDSQWFEFANPVSDKDRKDIRWYVETYGAHSLAEPDDDAARRIEARFPEIGKALLESVFDNKAAFRCFTAFQQSDADDRVITIESGDAAILSIPWELIHDTDGPFRFHDQPHVRLGPRHYPGSAAIAGTPTSPARSPRSRLLWPAS
ncbi:MAG: hypothetical protein AAGD07_23090 [Planctomycetota bacterium]